MTYVQLQISYRVPLIDLAVFKENNIKPFLPMMTLLLFQHIKRSLKPTDRYYRNEHLEIQAEATNKYATTNNRDISVVCVVMAVKTI